ncbi:hypothetical protein N0V86_009483 [Didymella sp. IMI 355093]|nr:hypothetical protein N0V86_009483 [Didymella sp. IMI 355093]
MGNVLGVEKTRLGKHTSTTTTSLQTPPRTPTLNATAAQALASEIHDIHHALSELPDLRPGDKVNTLLTRLVSLCVIPYGTDFVTYFFNIGGVATLCEKLRPLCATAEGELERFWASKIIDDSVKSQATSHQTQAFLATFPYPLSISHDLCSRLGYGDRMSFACTDVSAEEDDEKTKWADFDVVFLAALVGMDTSFKLAILEGLVRKLKPGTLVVARSAKGLRGVLYPILELGEDLEKAGLEMLVEVHPWTKVVNSVIVFRVKER